MEKAIIETFYPQNRQAWRDWLVQHHQSAQAVWLVQYKKKAAVPTITWSEAVEEALCFGWIDSIRKSVDDEKFIQFFSQRKPKSTWSRINKIHVERLIEQGLMTEMGHESIATAKANGSWIVLDEVEDMIIPEELTTALAKSVEASEFFFGLSKSVRKAMLQWIAFAKRPETKSNRIEEIVTLAAKRQKPKQF